METLKKLICGMGPFWIKQTNCAFVLNVEINKILRKRPHLGI